MEKNLKSASNRLKDNYEIVLNAVRQEGVSLEYASDRLKDNREIVVEAIKNSEYAFRYASERLKNDISIILDAVKSSKYGDIFRMIPDHLKSLKENYEFAVKAVKSNSKLIDIFDKFKNNPSFILDCMKSSDDPYFSPTNIAYHEIKSKFPEFRNKFIQKMKEVESLEKSLIENPKEKQKINNRIGKVKAEIENMKRYAIDHGLMKNKDLMTEEDIEEALKSGVSVDRPFRTEEGVWQYGSGQTFIQDAKEENEDDEFGDDDKIYYDDAYSEYNESVFPIYLDKRLYLDIAKDPLLAKFISHIPSAGHFLDTTSPVGWGISI